MKCPECGLIDHDSKVTNSRHYKNTIKRTRKCSICGHNWKTYEVTEEKYEYLASRDKTGRRFWTAEEIKNLIRLKEQGVAYKEIGKRLGRTASGIKHQVSTLLDTGDYFTYLEELEQENIRPVKVVR